MAADPTRSEAAAAGSALMVTSNFPRWRGDSTTPFVLHLAQDLRALGWHVEVLAPHAPGAALSEDLDGIPVRRFRYFWPERSQTVCYNGGALGNLRRRPLNFAKLPMLVASEWAATRHHLATRRFDLVHSHWILPQGYVCSIVAKALGIPHLATVHGGDVFAMRNRVLDRFRRLALATAQRVTVNSSVTRGAVEKLAGVRPNVVHIPMGATERAADAAQVLELRSCYREGPGPLLLFVGRLVEEKGIDDAVSAMPAILRSRPQARLLVVGDGPDRARFENRAAALGIADRVSFAGWVDSRRLPDYYAAADLFLGPSKRAPNGWVEAQGLTFAEALLAGVPVIATRCGGIVDVIRDGQTGLLVDEGSPDEIAAATLRLLGDPALARSLAATGQEFARTELTRAASARAFAREYAALRAGAQPEVFSKT
ncbi:MAG TPA: glycosyltransferase family 4 protein [Steroidobacteraceae bacterium]